VAVVIPAGARISLALAFWNLISAILVSEPKYEVSCPSSTTGNFWERRKSWSRLTSSPREPKERFLVKEKAVSFGQVDEDGVFGIEGGAIILSGAIMVTMNGEEVAVLPESSRATAVTRCTPGVAYHRAVKGVVLARTATSVESANRERVFRPILSTATAEIVVVPGARVDGSKGITATRGMVKSFSGAVGLCRTKRIG